jgi:hypothetical protein
MDTPTSKNRWFAVEDEQNKTRHEIEWWSDQAIGHQTQVLRLKDLSVSAQWVVQWVECGFLPIEPLGLGVGRDGLHQVLL